jgi:hypothetical protein
VHENKRLNNVKVLEKDIKMQKKKMKVNIKIVCDNRLNNATGCNGKVKFIWVCISNEMLKIESANWMLKNYWKNFTF